MGRKQQKQSQPKAGCPQAAGACHAAAAPSSSAKAIAGTCVQCQARKIKCKAGSAGGQPHPCANCEASGWQCSYPEAKRRGPKPGQLLRVKEEAKHIKMLLRSLIQAMCSVSPRHSPIGDIGSRLLADDETFNAASLEAMTQALADCSK